MLAVLAAPDRNWRTPKSVSGNVPIAGVSQPIPETTLPYGFGNPMDLFVVFDHLLFELSDLYKSSGHGFVNERRATSIAKRITMLDGVMADEPAHVPNFANDFWIGFLYVLTCKFGNSLGKIPLIIDAL